MNDKELQLQFQIAEEKHNNAVSRLESRLSEINQDLRSFKDSHANEHTHNTIENDLKIDLLKKDLKAIETKLSHLDKQEQKDINKKTLNYTAIGVWIGAISLVSMLVIQIYNGSPTSSQQEKQKEAK